MPEQGLQIGGRACAEPIVVYPVVEKSVNEAERVVYVCQFVTKMVTVILLLEL